MLCSLPQRCIGGVVLLTLLSVLAFPSQESLELHLYISLCLSTLTRRLEQKHQAEESGKQEKDAKAPGKNTRQADCPPGRTWAETTECHTQTDDEKTHEQKKVQHPDSQRPIECGKSYPHGTKGENGSKYICRGNNHKQALVKRELA